MMIIVQSESGWDDKDQKVGIIWDPEGFYLAGEFLTAQFQQERLSFKINTR